VNAENVENRLLLFMPLCFVVNIIVDVLILAVSELLSDVVLAKLRV